MFPSDSYHWDTQRGITLWVNAFSSSNSIFSNGQILKVVFNCFQHWTNVSLNLSFENIMQQNVVAKFCEVHYESLKNKKGRVLGKKFQAGKFPRKNCQRLDLVTLDWHPLHFQILERQIYHTETTWNPDPFSWQEKNKLDFFYQNVHLQIYSV